jgi:hypothetical protein
MARTSLRKIYYWGIKLDRLHIHMASTEKGALRIGLGFNSPPHTKDFFKKLYPNSELLENHDVNRPLQQAVEAAFSNKASSSVKAGCCLHPLSMVRHERHRPYPFRGNQDL